MYPHVHVLGVHITNKDTQIGKSAPLQGERGAGLRDESSVELELKHSHCRHSLGQEEGEEGGGRGGREVECRRQT